MKKLWRRWLRVHFLPPAGESPRVRTARRAALFLAGILLVAEIAVSLRYSGAVGGILVTATVGLSAFTYRGLQAIVLPPTRPGATVDGPIGGDPETGLADRRQLVATLGRDMARAQRYGHPLTLAIVRIDGFDRLDAQWGPALTVPAAQHVSGTLVRVTRASDFVARFDEATFAVILGQCSGAQAGLYADRATRAVNGRPVRTSVRLGSPFYLDVRVAALQFDPTRCRGPIEFLDLAGVEGLGEDDDLPFPGDGPGHRPQTLPYDYLRDAEMGGLTALQGERRRLGRHAG